MHGLLEEGDGTPGKALARCRASLSGRWSRWRWAHALLPATGRDEVCALLAWQGLTRAIAGEAGFARRRGLDLLRRELDDVAAERPRSEIAVALSWVARRNDVPLDDLRAPIEAWARDENLATFETRAALLAHARALAGPEARVLTRLLGHRDERLQVLAEALGTALQLTAWIVDLRGELARGRIRLPIDLVLGSGADLTTLFEPAGSGALARILAGEVEWIRGLYEKGWPLCRALGPWNGRRLCFVLRWHAASLAALEFSGYRPRPGPPPAGWPRLVTCALASVMRVGPPRLRA